ncbi:YbaB/EbfC family nucleoid-associated protein [Amycolatopsis speibonae]|uniref:YbaB/EbfC family nucleoid-associated protein n=1 Tax=Amycolatopsis speibonae TaxID=1450224 RepID=A0ABV7NUL4_9PSEU
MADQEAKLDAAIRSFQEQAAKAAELKDKIAGLRGSARNADGTVAVTVAPSGALLGLQLSPKAMNRTHTALQQDILKAIREATQQAAAAMQQTVQPILGDRAEQFKEAFNAHVEPLGPSAPPPAESLAGPAVQQPVRTQRPARPAPSEDDDFGGPILRRDS